MAAHTSSPQGHTPRRADDIDRLIGKTLRSFRKEAGLTQKQLGDAVMMSFKQIRKYELGENRISASMLYALSKALDKSVDAFYQDILDPQGDTVKGTFKESVIKVARESEEKDSAEAESLIRLYYKINRKQERQAFMDLLRSISLATKE